MSHDLARPIYGNSTKPDTTVCFCFDIPALAATLTNMVRLINTLKESVEKYLPALSIGVSLRGTIATPLKVPAFIMVRILWNDKYPSIKPNKDNYFYRSTIKDFYFALGRGGEWSNDPLSLIAP